MDQLFSLLTQKFKSEIRTIEELKHKIVTSGILPQPNVEELDFIWDWKSFALDNLTKEELRNHSNYHGFNIKKQNGQARLRGKRYLFEKEWFPPTGIRVLAEDTKLEPVDVAPFRIESLNIPKVYQDLKRFLATLPLVDRMTVQNSWDSLRRKLEDLPFQLEKFEKMNLNILPPQSVDNPIVIPDHLSQINKEDVVKDMEGDTFPEDLDDADFNEDIREGLDVLIYSDVKQGRPWLGRIVKVTGPTSFQIQWYERKKSDRHMFCAALRKDGTPYVSDCDAASVILWNFSTRVDDSSFSVSKFFLSHFKVEYARHDSLLVEK